MLVGAENGNVRVFPLRESATTPGQYDIGNFKSHWTLCVHDNQYGRVTHICCSHDDKYILTAGHDGNVFVFQASLEAGLKKKEAEHLGDTKVSRTGAQCVTTECVCVEPSYWDLVLQCVCVCVPVHVCTVCTCVCMFHSLLQSVLDLTREVKDIEDPNAYRCVIHSSPPGLRVSSTHRYTLTEHCHSRVFVLVVPSQH